MCTELNPLTMLSIRIILLVNQHCNSNIEYSQLYKIESINNIRTSAGDGSKVGGTPKGMSDISTFKIYAPIPRVLNSEVFVKIYGVW